MNVAFVSALAALGAILGVEALAEELLVEISGAYAKDPKFGESFGSLEDEIPVAMTLLIDESRGFHLPDGTPLIDGQAVATQMLVLPKNAIISASAALGDIQWSETNLIDVLPRSDLGFRPAVILMGGLQSDSVKIYLIIHDENRGSLQINYLKCDGDCALVDEGRATDLRTGSWGKLGQLKVTVSRYDR